MPELFRRDRLKDVHPDLVRVVQLAADRAPWPICVIEGARTLERQQKLMSQGASRTLKSRHIPGADGLAKAVDIAPAPDMTPSWAWPLYHQLAPIVKQAAAELGVTIEWGGDWASFKDGPHWQLSALVYP
jgi:peptidoglycan L-alanyl-D-glutamate endopeptidase CwlK